MAKVFISGGISMYPDWEWRANFEKAETFLKLMDYEVVSPRLIEPIVKEYDIEIKDKEERIWIQYMRACIRDLMNCDYIYFIEGHESSHGSKRERDLARTYCIKELVR